MKKFFICTTGIAKGPYVMEELYRQPISERDLIWNQDWRDSKYAAEIEELKKHFGAQWSAVKKTGKSIPGMSSLLSSDFFKNSIILIGLVAVSCLVIYCLLVFQ